MTMLIDRDLFSVARLVAMVRPETMGEEAVQYVVAKYDYDAQEAQVRPL